MATPFPSKPPQPAVRLLETAPDLYDVVSIHGSGLSCDDCGEPARWFDGTRILCQPCLLRLGQ
jgi:hypothetical protein